MAPQTRNTFKASPGRLTRNSVFGRPPLSSSKPQMRSSDKSPVHAQARNTEGKVTADVSAAELNKWVELYDTSGVTTTVTKSETGEGILVRWHYADDHIGMDKNDNTSIEMSVDEERGVTPVTTLGSSGTLDHPFPQTPMAFQPYDAGSVLLTPVKKSRPLQPSPARIGDKGIRCIHEEPGTPRAPRGSAPTTLHYPTYPTAMLSPEEIDRLAEELEEQLSEVTDSSLFFPPERAGESGSKDASRQELHDTLPPAPLEEMVVTQNFLKGPNGELLDRRGRQMLGPVGTILLYPDDTTRMVMKKEPSLISDSTESSSYNGGKAACFRRARFGPEGTELIH